jgi:hypothetical protein
MKPLNLDNSPCSPTSSNCVIWQGPDLACIKLCAGDTVSDVIAKLATELCTILDQLNIENYDLSCFNSSACPPGDFQELIQFLINHICELEGVTPIDKSVPTCPDCVVSVAACFIEGTTTTMQLVDYVNMIANRICSILTAITDLQNQINELDIRVTVLENAPPPIFTLPSILVDCTLQDTPYIGFGGAATPINTVLEALINDNTYGYCALRTATGLPAELQAAVASQCITSATESLVYGTPMGTAYLGTWVGSPSTVADAITDLWISICDIRNYLESFTLNVADTSTIDLNYTSGILTAKIIDTGWINLNGFEYYDMTYTGSASFRPQCRRIGNVVHFRGFLVVPLAVSADIKSPLPYGYRSSPGYDSYFAVPHPFTATTGAGSCVLGLGEFLTFNEGSSVIPTGILSAGETLDKSYGIGFRIAVRPINVGIAPTSISTMLTSLASVNINSNGTLEWGPTSNSEESVVVGNTISFNTSPVNYIQSIVTAGDNVPKFSSTGSTYDGAVANPTPPATTEVLVTELDYLPTLVYPFSVNSTLAAQLGGLGVRIDGLTSFINPCTESTIVGLPC